MAKIPHETKVIRNSEQDQPTAKLRIRLRPVTHVDNTYSGDATTGQNGSVEFSRQQSAAARRD